MLPAAAGSGGPAARARRPVRRKALRREPVRRRPRAPLGESAASVRDRQDFALLVWKVGDVLALAMFAVTGVALVRAFTAPFALGSARGRAGVDVPAAVALVIGLAVAAGCWPVAAALLRSRTGRARRSVACMRWPSVRLRPDERPGTGAARAADAVVGLLLAAAAVAGLAGLVLRPFSWAGALGVVAVTALALGCVVVLVSLAVLLVQRREPLELFGAIGLHRTPLLTLVLAVPVGASLNGGDPAIHSIRTLDRGVSQVSRPTLDAAFGDWLERPPGSGCAGAVRVTKRNLPVRPMVLVAAAGGGIRAAVWTAYGVDHLVRGVR